MKLRSFVRSNKTGRPVPGAQVTLVLEIDAKQRFDLSMSLADRLGYSRLVLDAESFQQRLLALVLANQVTTQNGFALRLAVKGCPDSAVTLFELRPGANPGTLAMLANGPKSMHAFLTAAGGDTPFVFEVDASVQRGPEGRVTEPDAVDYALSPESFLMQPEVKLGDGGGCEHLAPASLPLRQYSIYQVAVLGPAPAASPADGLPSVHGTIVNDNQLRWGQLLEYRQTWRSLGHSLGEIKYSLSLAPGEAIKVAVIDWKREDRASRTGANRSDEGLAHQQTVERDIDDVVSGRINEEQQGSSVIAGLAGGMDFTVPQYGISAAGRHSIGAGFAYTRGSRQVAAQAHQDIHQQVLQRSNLARSQSSTVVVQATQEESSYLATRIVANMNRGHALSILYYEILRHLAVRTVFVRADPCVLVPVSPITFDRALARRYRTQIEPVLLNGRHALGFDAIERIDSGQALTGGGGAPPPNSGGPAPTAPPQRSPVATRFEVTLSSEWRRNYVFNRHVPPADTAGAIRVVAQLNDGTEAALVSLDDRPPVLEQFTNIGQFPSAWPAWSIGLEEFDQASQRHGRIVATCTTSQVMLDLRSLRGFVVRWRRFGPNAIGSELDGWNLTRLKIVAHTADKAHVLVDHGYQRPTGRFELFPPTSSAEFQANASAPLLAVDLSLPAPTPAPEPATAPATAPTSPTAAPAAPSPSDDKLATALVNHLNDNRFFYGAEVWLHMDPRERRLRLGQVGAGVMSQVADQPLAMSGNHLAFRFYGELPAELRTAAVIEAQPPLESVTTLPTRGVFAEAHLGHCNAAEERDVTRYWAFDELPVSLLPNIETLTAGPRGQLPSLSPDALAPGQLSIQSTPALQAAGDAVAKAFELLAKPDIFRDMSARQEVAQVMGKLIEAAKPPPLTGANVGSAFGSGAGAPAEDPPKPKTSPAKPQDPSQTPAQTGTSFLDPDRFSGAFIDPKKAFDSGVVFDSLLGKLDLPPSEKTEIKTDFAKQTLATPRATPAAHPVTVSLSSRIADKIGATRALNGTVTLDFYAPAPTGASERWVASVPIRVEQGVGAARLAHLPADIYSVRVRYEPHFASADLAFLREPQFEATGVNLRWLVNLVHDLMQRDLDAGFDQLIRGATGVVVGAKTRMVVVGLEVDLAPDGQHSFSATLGSSAGVTIKADRSVSIDTDGLSKSAGSIAGALKGAGAAATALLSLISFKSNLSAEGKLANVGDTELKLAFTPRFVQDAHINVSVGNG